MQTDQHQTLRRLLAAKGMIDPAAQWHPCKGGRTNRIWRIGNGKRSQICKLYVKAKDTPLFPNIPHSEQQALMMLSGTGLCPTYSSSLETPFGTCILYQYVEGHAWQSDVSLVAQHLLKVHKSTPPNGLRKIEQGAAAILDAGAVMLPDLKPALARELQDIRPKPAQTSLVFGAFLHGDPVPANIIVGPNGPVLIDWQCPAIGDPCEDLAIFLSPSMQLIYGGKPLSDDDIIQFLAVYDGGSYIKRYQTLAPAFHWRMAVYCAWKDARGEHDYRQGMIEELRALQMYYGGSES